MASSSTAGDDEQSLFQRALDTALAPIRLALTPTAIKAYLSTLLFLIISGVLLALSTTAYLFFYYNFIPQINLEHVVYLQYGSDAYPHATILLDHSALISQQPYDITVHLHVPLTPNNLAAGNFMLDLSLLTSSTDPLSSTVSRLFPNSTTSIQDQLPYTTLFTSKRPAILPYASPLLSLSSTLLNFPLHILSFRDLDSAHLSIPMFEQMSFARGAPSSNIPKAIHLEVQTPTAREARPLEVYSARIEFTARFQGLRYVVYNYRVLSFLLFTAVFYGVALSSMAVFGLGVTLLFHNSNHTQVKQETSSDRRIKQDPHSFPSDVASEGKQVQPKFKQEPRDNDHGYGDDDELEDDEQAASLSALSDAQATTFPGIGRQMPLRVPVRSPSQGSQRNKRQLSASDPAGAEARDSGYGTASASRAGVGDTSTTGVAQVTSSRRDNYEENGEDRGRASFRGGTNAGIGIGGSDDTVQDTAIEPLLPLSATGGEAADDEDEEDDEGVEHWS